VLLANERTRSGLSWKLLTRRCVLAEAGDGRAERSSAACDVKIHQAGQGQRRCSGVLKVDLMQAAGSFCPSSQQTTIFHDKHPPKSLNPA
jgi:hypothetical protein